jgi:hypothetical protein
MSATTIAVATMTDTVDPLAGSGPAHAALPVSDAAMSVHALRSASRPGFFIVQADFVQFKQC